MLPHKNNYSFFHLHCMLTHKTPFFSPLYSSKPIKFSLPPLSSQTNFFFKKKKKQNHFFCFLFFVFLFQSIFSLPPLSSKQISSLKKSFFIFYFRIYLLLFFFWSFKSYNINARHVTGFFSPHIFKCLALREGLSFAQNLGLQIEIAEMYVVHLASEVQNSSSNY